MSNAQELSRAFHVQPIAWSDGTVTTMEPLTPRAILAANIRKLIGTDSVRNWAISRGLDVRLIDRITKGGNATLETIDEIAQACSVPAWHLLLPDFEPGTKIDTPVTESERQLLERLKRLLG
ncbi:hypothetical protein [Roseateles sp. P5_E11]